MRTSIRTAGAAVVIAATVAASLTATPSSGATPTLSDPPSSLTLTETYYGAAYDSGGWTLGAYVAAGTFDVPSWAKYVSSVVVTDASGLPTAGFVETESRVDNSGTVTRIGDFCGRTTQSYPVDPSTIRRVWVTLNQGPCSDGTIAAGTTGTITITFTS
jgi:hypothetical protein